jgi:O-antigen ligase
MRARRLAAAGIALALLTIGWAQLAGAHHHTQAGSYSLRVAAVLVAWLLGALVGSFAGRRGLALVSCAVIVAVGVAFAVAPGSLSGRALAPPLHYGNADGAFAAAAVAAGGLLVTLPVWRVLRLLGGLAALAFLVVCHQTQSVAAFAAALASLAVCVIATLAPSAVRRVLALAAPVVVVLAAVFTVVVGVSYQPGHRAQPLVVRAAEHGLTQRRAALWHDATVIVRDHPVDGVGPGGFAVTSPVARSDRDARWAHSAWLQQASDQGLVGLALFAGAIGVGWWILLRRRADAVTVAASWALGALLLQASIDYVLDFVAVPVVIAVIVGAATTGSAASKLTTRRLARIPANAGIPG